MCWWLGCRGMGTLDCKDSQIFTKISRDLCTLITGNRNEPKASKTKRVLDGTRVSSRSDVQSDYEAHTNPCSCFYSVSLGGPGLSFLLFPVHLGLCNQLDNNTESLLQIHERKHLSGRPCLDGIPTHSPLGIHKPL